MRESDAGKHVLSLVQISDQYKFNRLPPTLEAELKSKPVDHLER